jgi:hypothetical protein
MKRGFVIRSGPAAFRYPTPAQFGSNRPAADGAGYPRCCRAESSANAGSSADFPVDGVPVIAGSPAMCVMSSSFR